MVICNCLLATTVTWQQFDVEAMHGVFVKAMSNHPILLSGVQWSGVHVSSVNECVAVLAVCEAPQGQPHSILCALSCRSQ